MHQSDNTTRSQLPDERPTFEELCVVLCDRLNEPQYLTLEDRDDDICNAMHQSDNSTHSGIGPDESHTILETIDRTMMAVGPIMTALLFLVAILIPVCRQLVRRLQRLAQQLHFQPVLNKRVSCVQTIV